MRIADGQKTTVDKGYGEHDQAADSLAILSGQKSVGCSSLLWGREAAKLR